MLSGDGRPSEKGPVTLSGLSVFHKMLVAGGRSRPVLCVRECLCLPAEEQRARALWPTPCTGARAWSPRGGHRARGCPRRPRHKHDRHPGLPECQALVPQQAAWQERRLCPVDTGRTRRGNCCGGSRGSAQRLRGPPGNGCFADLHLQRPEGATCWHHFSRCTLCRLCASYPVFPAMSSKSWNVTASRFNAFCAWLKNPADIHSK